MCISMLGGDLVQPPYMLSVLRLNIFSALRIFFPQFYLCKGFAESFHEDERFIPFCGLLVYDDGIPLAPALNVQSSQLEC